MKIEEASNFELLEELIKRENTRIEQLEQCEFEYTKKLTNGLIGKIYIDNSAPNLQIRVEVYESEEDLKNGDYLDILDITDSIDEALIILRDFEKDQTILGEN